MKKRLTPIVAIVLMAMASQAFAQNARVTSTVTTEKHDPAFSLGRDFWFAPGQNYLDEPGKYIRIYITSPNNTTAYVELGGVAKAVPIPANGIGIFNVGLAWEMKSSGVVENKAIHVYDSTDDISVNVMCHNPYSSDGMYCIPTIGWGTDYVVASYESLSEDFGSYGADFPSEFTISSDRDNTVVEITPTCDIRYSTEYPSGSNTVGHPRGKKFEDTLNRGQSIEYEAVFAEDAYNFDATGTIIHSNNPIGLVGASGCPNIPPDYPYCDYVTDMMRPVRTWGETYFTTTPIQPQGSTSHNSAMYLMVASKNNQTIHIYDAVRGDRVVTTIDSQYHIFWAEETMLNKWYSDAPFLLVQYINSATYPDGNNGNGDPAEAVISPRESYPKNVFYIAPPVVGSQGAYVNYANVVVNNNDIHNVTFDGNSIQLYQRQTFDDTFSIYLVPQVKAGAHIVKSDSGVGVYGYGYGYDETFSWGGSSGAATFNSPDTTPPVAVFSSNCFGANVGLADTGTLASKISEIILDSDVNMLYLPDTNFLAGVGYDTSYYNISVVDITKPAILKISAFDFAGNRTTVTSIYSPQIAAIQPALQNFGSTLASDSPIVLFDTLVNTGALPVKLSNVSLLHGNVGFTIESSGGSDTVIAGEHRPVKISFLPVKTTLAVDTIVYFDECFRYAAALVGGGGGADFFVSDADWKSVPLAPYPVGSWTAMSATIHNLSKLGPIDVDTAGLTDPKHFILLPNQSFPIHLTAFGTAGDTASIWFYFEPTDLHPDTDIVSWTSPQVRNSDNSLAIRNNLLIGNAVAPHLTFGGDTAVTINCPSLSDSLLRFEFVLSNTGTGASAISKVTISDTTDFVNLTGHDEHGLSWNPAKQSENLPAGEIDTFTVDFPVRQHINISAATTITAIGIPGDTLGDSSLRATVNINYWAAQISAGSLNFGTVPSTGAKVTQSFTITNTARSNLTISYLGFNGPTSPYSFNTVPSLPATLPPQQFMTVYVTFDPSISADPVQNDNIQFEANWCQDTTISLYAIVSAVDGVDENSPPTAASILQLDDGKSIKIIIPPDWTQPARLDIYNILGETVYTTTFDGTAIFDLGELPRGVYFYRLREADISQTGKILLNQ